MSDVKNLQSLRNNADDLNKRVNVEIKMPRILKRQTFRVNINSENSEMYFKRSIIIIFLDFIIASMYTCFNQRLVDIVPLERLISTNFNMYDDKIILKAAKVYAQNLQITSYTQS